MDKPLQLFLFLIAFAFVMYISFYPLLRIKKKLRSRKISDKRHGIKEVKKIADENTVDSVVNIGFSVFKNWF
jgi:F0F1-type ATP synthase membrane subunit b/b'